MSEPLSLAGNALKRKRLGKRGIGIGLTFALLGPLIVYGVVKVQRASQTVSMA